MQELAGVGDPLGVPDILLMVSDAVVVFDNLAGKIELTDERDRPVELPDSNCLIVIEKR